MNEKIFLFFYDLSFQNGALDQLIVFTANRLIWLLFLFIMLLFFYKKISLQNLIQIIIATLLSWVVAKIIKHFYFSPRPFLVLPELKTLLVHGLNDSFPSGHTTFAFALATATFLFTKCKESFFLLSGAILIGISRIITGVHWPSDILGGAILGIIISWLVYLFLKEKRS